METCRTCGRVTFRLCENRAHGSWCLVCTGYQMTCPRCAQAGGIVVELATGLLILAAMVGLLWLPRLLGPA